MSLLDKLEEVLIAFSMFMAAVLVVLNVILRALGTGLTGSEDIIRYLLILVTFIGSSVCVRKGVHISIDFIFERTHGKLNKALQLYTYVVGVVFSCLLSWYGLELSLLTQASKQLAPAIKIPVYLIYLIIPLAGLLMIIRYGQQIMKVFRNWHQNYIVN